MWSVGRDVVLSGQLLRSGGVRGDTSELYGQASLDTLLLQKESLIRATVECECWRMQGQGAGNPYGEHLSGPPLRDGKNPAEPTAPARSPGNGVRSRARHWCLLRASVAARLLRAGDPRH